MSSVPGCWLFFGAAAVIAPGLASLPRLGPQVWNRSCAGSPLVRTEATLADRPKAVTSICDISARSRSGRRARSVSPRCGVTMTRTVQMPGSRNAQCRSPCQVPSGLLGGGPFDRLAAAARRIEREAHILCRETREILARNANRCLSQSGAAGSMVTSAMASGAWMCTKAASGGISAGAACTCAVGGRVPSMPTNSSTHKPRHISARLLRCKPRSAAGSGSRGVR